MKEGSLALRLRSIFNGLLIHIVLATQDSSVMYLMH